jgi:hypothetical protein
VAVVPRPGHEGRFAGACLLPSLAVGGSGQNPHSLSQRHAKGGGGVCCGTEAGGGYPRYPRPHVRADTVEKVVDGEDRCGKITI